MVGLGALDLILRSVHAGVMGVAFDVEIVAAAISARPVLKLSPGVVFAGR